METFHHSDTLSDHPPSGAGTDGTQAIRRAAAVLRALAKAGPAGASLAEVAREQALPRSTVHRILRCLVDERLAALPGGDKRYRLGELVHELSLAPSASALEVAHWRQAVEAVARRTGATAYLMRRSGIEAVCLIKADGQDVVRFVPVDVGQRRLLGVGAGSTALLAALDDAALEQVLSSIAPGLKRYPRLDADSVRSAVRLARRTGFAISQGTVVDDGFGIGAIVPDAGATPHLAISIAAHASRVTESLIGEWQRVIAQEIEAALARG